MPITEASVVDFRLKPRAPWHWEYYYAGASKKWRAATQFDVTVELDRSLQPVERGLIEYRQYVRGGVWVKRGRELEWPPDHSPNGNAAFKIPPYAGQTRCEGLPRGRVDGQGLSDSEYKEDGRVDGGVTYRYGHRDSATFDHPDEKDLWTPHNSSGPSYHLRDTPSVEGVWDPDDTVRVWIELYFKGFVVQVERDASNRAVPVRVLRAKSWIAHWMDVELGLISSATRITPPT